MAHGNSLGNFMQLNIKNYIESELAKEGGAKCPKKIKKNPQHQYLMQPNDVQHQNSQQQCQVQIMIIW
jgi:hypothetical protein